MTRGKVLIIIVLIVILGSTVWFFRGSFLTNIPEDPIVTGDIGIPSETGITGTPLSEAPLFEVVLSGLEIPWDFAFLSEGSVLLAERPGRLIEFFPDGTNRVVELLRVNAQGEGGLLGMTLHPQFRENRYLYLYMTTSENAQGTVNAVIRYRFENGELQDETVIVENIPGARFHDGGRIEFGPDGLLYVTTGDATREAIAQDLDSLGGKILRVHDDGRIPDTNPYGTVVFSYGHRNSQGLAWDDEGRLWSTEHGRSGILSGLDEINIIVPGGNYGWPVIQGDESQDGMQTPVRHSGASMTWAPASAAFLEGSLYFGGLRGEALYEAVLSGGRVVALREHFKGEFGRIRTVRVGADGMLYLTTSNRDGRGDVHAGDDKLIRVNPQRL